MYLANWCTYIKENYLPAGCFAYNIITKYLSIIHLENKI